MIIIPKEKRILILCDAVKENVTEGGIYVPDYHSEITRMATVLAIGKDVELYKPGDRVVVMYQGGTDLHFPLKGILKDTYRIIVESNIICQIKKEDEKGIEGKNEEKK